MSIVMTDPLTTCPPHHGFQVWHGVGDARALWHVEQEFFDPGSGSNLDRATRWLWSFIKCPAPKLPSDFFTFPADHEQVW